MTKPAKPYSRVYHGIVDDERFSGIYGDDRHLAAWLRLLLIADQAWPASANLPASVRRQSVDALVSCGLVERRAGGLYRIHGLDTERSGRQSRADTAAAARWSRPHPASIPDASGEHPVSTADGMPRRDETRRDEKSRDETSIAEGERDALDVYHELTGWRPWGQYSGDSLKGAIRDFGGTITEAGLRAEYATDKDRGSLLKRTLTRLARDADRQREEVKARPKRTRKDDRAEIAAVMRDLYAPTEVAS